MAVNWLITVFVAVCAVCANSHGVVGHMMFVNTPHSTRVARDAEESKPQQGRPEMTSLRVESDILYRYAKTSVASKLANRDNVAQEITFSAVLPQSAFISAFHIELEGKVYQAYVREKEEAHREYTEAVSQGRTAAKVDLSARDSNRFTVSVNVEATAKVVFNLTYEELLTRRLGVYNHVINLDPGQIVPELSVLVRIDESSALSSVNVPTLRVTNELSSSDVITDDPLASIERPESNKATIRWNPSIAEQRELKEEGVKGQLTVQYDIDRTSNPSQILVSDGYFVHFYSPADLAPLQKHVVFVLDISGSMSYGKLNQLKEAMATILSELQNGDYISIILFSSDVEVWLPETNSTIDVDLTSEKELNTGIIVPVNPENIILAKEFVANLDTEGATNIKDALTASLEVVRLGRKALKSPESESDVKPSLVPEPMVIFLTDGQPNVGQTDPEAIIRVVTQKNKRKTPIFSLAFGGDADQTFLKKLSLKNAAFSRLIYAASDAALQLRDFYRQVASPLLANVTFNYEPTQVVNDSLTNLHFNTLFQGAELVVAGKLEPNVDKLRGVLLAKSSTGKTRYGFPSPIIVTLPEIENKTAASFMEKLWAYLNIQQLLDQQALEDSSTSPSKDKALQLALKYSFVTPLTSLVVVKPNGTSRADAKDAATADRDDGFNLRGMPQSLNSNTQSLRSHYQPPSMHHFHAAPRAPAYQGAAGPPGNPGLSGYSSNTQAYQGAAGPPGNPGLSGYSSNTQDRMTLSKRKQSPSHLPEAITSFDSYDYSTTTDGSYVLVIPTETLYLSNLTWPSDSNNGTHVMVTTDGTLTAFEISVKEPGRRYTHCNVASNNGNAPTQGYCTDLAYCILPIFKNDFQLYVTSHFCEINKLNGMDVERFAGVCCPNSVVLPSNVAHHRIP